MTAIPPLSPMIGSTERTLRALLGSQLAPAGLSFPEWTILVFLDGETVLTTEELITRQISSRVVPDEDATRATVNSLHTKGLIAPADDGDRAVRGALEVIRWVITPDGESVYRPLRETVSAITAEMYCGMPESDLEATYRTLREVARRASARLAAEES